VGAVSRNHHADRDLQEKGKLKHAFP